MKSQDIFDALSNADDELVERAASSMNKLKRPKKPSFLPVAAIIFAFLLTFGAIAFAVAQNPPPFTTESSDSESASETEPPYGIPITEIIASPEPEQGLIGSPNMTIGGGEDADIRTDGIYAKVKALRILPDKYRFFSDKNAFYLVEMQTLSALPESLMPTRFYFLVPEAYITDLTAYPTLILHDMWQFTYENSVLYNTVQKQAEMLPYTIFASYWGTSYFSCERVMAFDENGIFDISLWNSTEKWKVSTASRDWLENSSYYEYAVIGYGWTADQCEEAIARMQDKSLYAKTLSSITSSEMSEAVAYARDPANGLFVPSFHYELLFFGPSVQLTFRRYINGYPTDEYISISGDTVTYSQAEFTETDAATRIDLASAVGTVSKELDAGNIIPPHLTLTDSHKLLRRGLFAWYAKTEDGILGVVKISWIYEDNENMKMFFDDKYFIIEPDSAVCQAIDRDELIKTVSASGYIFYGEYKAEGFDMIFEVD